MSINMQFSQQQRQDFYNLLEQRRDVRGEFIDRPIDEAQLQRILKAAHCAPSVGFMQPWNFILIRDLEKRQEIEAIFTKARNEERLQFEGTQQSLYDSLKLQGITRAPINICVTCDPQRGGKTGLGRTHNPQMAHYSSVCAIQNMWLAARVENIGMGWVSIYDESLLRQSLHIPDRIDIIAYLCLGHVSHFHPQPELQTRGWQQRYDLDDMIMQEQWQNKPAHKS